MTIIPPQVKLAIAAILLAGAFVGGWKVESWRCDAAKEAAVTQALVTVNKDIDEYKAERDAKDRAKDVDRATYTKQRAGMQKHIDALEENIRNHAHTYDTVKQDPREPSGPAEYPFNRDFLRDWNDALQPPGSEAGGADRPGLLGTDTSAARVTREDVIRNHKRLAELYWDCKVKQDHVIDWDQKQHPIKGDPPK